MFVCSFDPINGKTAEPIGPTFSVEPYIGPEKVEHKKLENEFLENSRIFFEYAQIRKEKCCQNLKMIYNERLPEQQLKSKIIQRKVD